MSPQCRYAGPRKCGALSTVNTSPPIAVAAYHGFRAEIGCRLEPVDPVQSVREKTGRGMVVSAAAATNSREYLLGRTAA